MRDIKFRAWDKEFKKFSPRALNYSINEINNLTDYEWSQYTGIKDKNGKEIYEGDIICYNNLKKGPRSRMTVKWSEEGACYQLLAFKEDWCYELGMCYEFTLEVIGNIYENSDLLEV